MVYLKKICTLEHQLAFIDNYRALSKTGVDLKYVGGSQVYGLWSRRNLVGGFILRRGPDLRTLHALREPLNIDLSPIIQDLAEVTCLWIKASHRNFLTRSLVVVGIALAIIKMRPKRIIAYTTKPKLHASTYSVLNLMPIFIAQLKDSPHQGIFYTISPYGLVLSLPSFLWKRLSKANTINNLGVKHGCG